MSDTWIAAPSDNEPDLRGFAAFDDALLGGALGLVRVRCPPGLGDALVAHARRRALGAGRALFVVGSFDGAESFRDLALACGATPALDASEHAALLASRLPEGLVLLRSGPVSAWGSAVAAALAEALAEGAARRRLLVLYENADDGKVTPSEGGAIVVMSETTADERRRFWEALDAAREQALGALSLAKLEAFWQRAAGEGTAIVPHGVEAETLWRRLALAREPLPAALATRLGAGLDELVRGGKVLSAAAWVSVLERPARRPDAADRAAVLSVLEQAASAEPSPFTFARIAELHAEAGQGTEAEEAMTRALCGATNDELRRDLWRRWQLAAQALAPDTQGARALRLGHLAIELGDYTEAMQHARQAASALGDSFEALLLLGRAALGRRDIVTAEAALRHAHTLASDAPRRATSAVELGRLLELSGDHEGAARCAEEALNADDPRTRLDARNLVGKALLARAAWPDAERHFAVDARDALLAGLPTAALRARVNGAISAMGAGRRDRAQTALLDVLAEAEKQGDFAASCFALSNLSTNAMWGQAWGEALALAERAVTAARRSGRAEHLVKALLSLAANQLEVGLVHAAEHSLAAARRAFLPSKEGAPAMRLSLLLGKVHLERGRFQEAEAALRVALTELGEPATGEELGVCCRLAAELALQEGHVQRAKAAVEQARAVSLRGDTAARSALLAARVARAAGEAYAELAESALGLAREGGHRVLAAQAHALLGSAALLRGEQEEAMRQLSAGRALRDAVAETLPSAQRAAFLAKSELAELLSLELRLAQPMAPTPKIRPPVLLPAPRFAGLEPAMLALEKAVQRVGNSEIAVLVQGESGVGKELVAEALHAASPRRAGPLVKVHCAALVETLLLSELFGHEKGAFTGATTRKLGRFELADGGTLFLDEVGEISPGTQVSLLRVLQDKTFERVGGTRSIRASCRIICATHRDLPRMVRSGEFREDLYFRLAGVTLRVPPLRERPRDLPALAEAILGRLAAETGEPAKKISPAAQRALLAHNWPGNVRELENTLRAAALFAVGSTIELADLTSNLTGLAQTADVPGNLETHAPRRAPVEGPAAEVAYARVREGTSLGALKRDIERTCIANALADCHGNITHAADLLGMKRARVSQLVKQYGLRSSDANERAH